MAKLRINCTDCNVPVTKIFDGSLTIKGGQFPRLICNRCREARGMEKDPNQYSIHIPITAKNRIRQAFFDGRRKP